MTLSCKPHVIEPADVGQPQTEIALAEKLRAKIAARLIRNNTKGAVCPRGASPAMAAIVREES